MVIKPSWQMVDDLISQIMTDDWLHPILLYQSKTWTLAIGYPECFICSCQGRRRMLMPGQTLGTTQPFLVQRRGSHGSIQCEKLRVTSSSQWYGISSRNCECFCSARINGSESLDAQLNWGLHRLDLLFRVFLVRFGGSEGCPKGWSWTFSRKQLRNHHHWWRLPHTFVYYIIHMAMIHVQKVLSTCTWSLKHTKPQADNTTAGSNKKTSHPRCVYYWSPFGIPVKQAIDSIYQNHKTILLHIEFVCFLLLQLLALSRQAMAGRGEVANIVWGFGDDMDVGKRM